MFLILSFISESTVGAAISRPPKAPLPKGGCHGKRSEPWLGDILLSYANPVPLYPSDLASLGHLPLGKGGFSPSRFSKSV